MWRAVDGMSKELQKPAPRVIGTNGEEDAKTVIVSANSVEERLVAKSTKTLVAPQPMQQPVGPAPTSYFSTMDEVSIVKDFVISGLPTSGLTGEASVPSG